MEELMKKVNPTKIHNHATIERFNYLDELMEKYQLEKRHGEKRHGA